MEDNHYLNQILYSIEKYYYQGKINTNDLEKIKYFLNDFDLQKDKNNQKSGNNIKFYFKDIIDAYDADRFKENFKKQVPNLTKYKIKFDYKTFKEKIDSAINSNYKYLKIYFLQREAELFLGLSISKNIDYKSFDNNEILLEISENILKKIDKNVFETYVNTFENGYASNVLNKNTQMIWYALDTVQKYNEIQNEKFKMKKLSFHFIKFDNLTAIKDEALNNRISICVNPDEIDDIIMRAQIESHDFGTVYP